MIQNAILYVLRKKKRTCILFIILTTVLSFLYSSLNIMKLSNNLENNLYKISNTSISITQKDNQNFEESNISFNKIKELKIDLTKYTIEKNDGIFQEVLESVNGIKYIIKIMICSIIISGVIVLSLILILWLRERIHEIGILLSIGTSKLKIIFQFIFELIFISLPSIFVSFFLGNIISDQIIGTFIHNDDSTMIIQNLLKNDDIVSKLITFLQSYGMLLIVIFLSVAISCAMILIKKPKEILSKIS
jgi:putative ABC transport system permease protein